MQSCEIYVSDSLVVSNKKQLLKSSSAQLRRELISNANHTTLNCVEKVVYFMQ